MINTYCMHNFNLTIFYIDFYRIILNYNIIVDIKKPHKHYVFKRLCGFSIWCDCPYWTYGKIA